jgi:hypothetical protein
MLVDDSCCIVIAGEPIKPDGITLIKSERVDAGSRIVIVAADALMGLTRASATIPVSKDSLLVMVSSRI